MEDNFYNYLKLYKKSPKWFRHIIGEIYGLFPYEMRYGNVLGKFTALAQEGRSWSHEEHRIFQERKLKALIRHAFIHVPYYRKKYQEAGLNHEDFKALEDLTRFPFLTRGEIRENFKGLIADNIPERKRLYKTTSGSSGDPLELYQQKGVTRAKERAFLLDMFKMVGYRPRDKTVVLMGEVIKNLKRPWYYEPIDRGLIMSSYLLNESLVEQYCREIRRFRPLFIRGYPFIVFRLTSLMQANGQAPFHLKGIILASENVYDAHLNAIESFFGCPVFHFYGHTECGAIGGICHLNQAYHMYPEYGVVEIITADGKLARIGEQGEIVTTSLDNWVMPLIRFRTQDFAIYGGNSCSCGLNFPLIQKVLGREEEYVILREGRQIPFHTLLAGTHGKVFGMVKKFQFLQTEPGRLLLKIVPDPCFERNEAGAFFLSEIWNRVGKDSLEISVEYVDDIPLSQSGKTKAFLRK